MEESLTRIEIRRRVANALLLVSDETVENERVEQFNDNIDDAHAQAVLDQKWLPTRQTFRDTIGKEQKVLNYPPGGSPGSIHYIAYWDTELLKWIPLQKRVIASWRDDTITAEDGGEEFANILDRPQFYDEREQIKIWPYTDKQYDIQIEYQPRPTFVTDESFSFGDGLLVVYLAAANAWADDDEDKMVVKWERKYARRLAGLKAWQTTGEPIAIGTDDLSIGRDENTFLPNWDRGLSKRNTFDDTGN